MNTSHEVPGKPTSNRKFYAPAPRKTEGAGKINRDCVLSHIRTLARLKIAQKYRAVT